MTKILLDSDVLIDFRNKGLHADWVLGGQWVRFFSAVVLMELYAGAMPKTDRAWLDEIYKVSVETGRLVAPTVGDYRESGHILRRLRGGMDSRATSRTSHDVLIALSARQVGATLLTRNRKDFAAIREWCDFDLVLLSA